MIQKEIQTPVPAEADQDLEADIIHNSFSMIASLQFVKEVIF